MKVSVATKAIVGMVTTVAGAIAATFPSTGLGKACVVLAAGLTAFATVYLAKNTQTVSTGEATGPVTLGAVLGETGEVVGSVIADTGTAAGGVLAGTTGVVGAVLDATVGKLIPAKKAGGRHA